MAVPQPPRQRFMGGHPSALQEVGTLSAPRVPPLRQESAPGKERRSAGTRRGGKVGRRLQWAPSPAAARHWRAWRTGPRACSVLPRASGTPGVIRNGIATSDGEPPRRPRTWRTATSACPNGDVSGKGRSLQNCRCRRRHHGSGPCSLLSVRPSGFSDALKLGHRRAEGEPLRSSAAAASSSRA